jgi:beta-glucosidase
MQRIDDAVIRILRFKRSIGLFDNPLTVRAGKIGTEENRTAARALVSDSLVLLRNENDAIKKLSESKKILVAGQGANDIGMQCGGWTITWQGSHGPTTKGTTRLEGIKAATKGKISVTYADNGKAKGTFDAVIAVIGEDPYAESDGDRIGNINIRSRDLDVLKKAYEYNCPVIVIMLSGRPMDIANEYSKWDAFIAAWLPGTEGAGIADVLFGNRSVSGRTPYTWKTSLNGEVLYPFGHGITDF